jgi:prevent-host-death family protein
MTTTVAASDLRKRAADVINRVAYAGERVVLERHGKAIAAVVSLQDLARLRELEDRIDVAAAREALTEVAPSVRNRRGKTKTDKRKSGTRAGVTAPATPRGLIPWAKVKTDLGL